MIPGRTSGLLPLVGGSLRAQAASKELAPVVSPGLLVPPVTHQETPLPVLAPAPDPKDIRFPGFSAISRPLPAAGVRTPLRPAGQYARRPRKSEPLDSSLEYPCMSRFGLLPRDRACECPKIEGEP